MNNYLEEQLMASILASYKDYKNPNFSFVMQKVNSNFYFQLKESLAQYIVIDHTDLNYDVCETLEVKQNSKSIYIYLSLVGRYCYITNKGSIITANNNNDKTYNELIVKITQARIVMLTKEQLLHILPVAIECEDGEKHSSVLSLFFAPGLYIQ